MNTPIDTIVAQATPPGLGGIAIIRVSGPLVAKIIQTLLPTSLKPRQATLLPFLDGAGVALDEGIALYFPHPHSFTGEDVLELQGHGGPVVVDLLIQRLIQLGARLARPGEFSERAFLNDKLDLAQAEAIADLITASSHQAARSAMRSLQGVFSRAIHALIEKVIFTRMYIEAAIDFTDEEIDFLSDATLMNELAETLRLLNDITHEAKQGQLLREGITVVIAGAPNVGKSSLLNQLSDKEVAIVTDIPGTTRDVLRQHILLDGMPLHIIDTAGLRVSDDKVEQEGIKRAYQEIAQADLILYIQTVNTPLLDENQIRQQLAAGDQPLLCVRNKIDLEDELPSMIKETYSIISLSAKTGAGLDLLKSAIKQAVGFEAETDGLYLARRRHLDALAKARKHIEASLHTLKTTRAGELAAEDLRLAQQALDEITGAFSADDLLGRIFGSFCIGK